MPDILLVDYADTQLTSETSSITEDIFKEYSFDVDRIEYAHATTRNHLKQLPSARLIVAMGADACRALLPQAPPLKKIEGALMYHQELKTWVLPTSHPNCIYAPEGRGYAQFDVFYDHIRRSIDILNGTLAFPPVEGVQLDWEMIGHNGERGCRNDPNLWSGYFEWTDEEISRQWEMLDNWIYECDNPDMYGAESEVVFALDTESFTTDHLKPLTMIQVYDPRRNKAFAFNWGVIAQQRGLWQTFLRHPRARFELQNTKHDRKMLKSWLDVDLGDRDVDTMCMALGLTEKGKQTGLKYLSRQYCNASFYEEALDEWLDEDNINYGHIRPDVLAEYGCLDVFYTHQLARILPGLVEREGTGELVSGILLPAQRALAEVEYTGIRVDKQYADKLKEEWAPIVEAAIREVQDYAREMGFPRDPDVVKGQIVREICDCVPLSLRNSIQSTKWQSLGKALRELYSFNPPCDVCNKKRYTRNIDQTLNVASPTQMQHLCFDVLGMDETYEGRKTNKYFWKLNPSHQLTQLRNEYRELDYLSRNLIDGFGRFIRADGRVHPDFLLFGTVTGRLAVRNPAVQTIPKHSKNAKAIRRIFLPDEGCLVVDVDYSNLELYIAHHLTGDEVLLEGLQKDLHRTTAAAMYMKDYEEVTDAERQSAKPVNFGAGYNIGPGKLSKDINLINITGGQKSKAQEFLDAFWANYKVWNDARKGWIVEAMENCELRTELGRVRRWNLITKDNLWKVENQACNFKGQSMASDLCLTSVIRLQKELTKRGWGRVMITVHDSIVYSIKREYIHRAVELICEIMTDPVFETKTPFKVDVQVGANYGDMVAYDRTMNYKEREI